MNGVKAEICYISTFSNGCEWRSLGRRILFFHLHRTLRITVVLRNDDYECFAGAKIRSGWHQMRTPKKKESFRTLFSFFLNIFILALSHYCTSTKTRISLDPGLSEFHSDDRAASFNTKKDTFETRDNATDEYGTKTTLFAPTGFMLVQNSRWRHKN